MRKIMDEYGKSGQVAWVYRHYPIVKLHPNAALEAQALECASEIGGNDAFWSYTHRLYEVNTAAGQNAAGLEAIAKYININTGDFSKCLSSGKYVSKVDAHLASGFKAKVSGTPTSFITYGSGNIIPIEGAQDYAHVKSAVDIILKQSGN
jgi:protein-disulfide isomerase